MCNHLHTTVISYSGFVYDLQLPIRSVSDVSSIELDLLAQGYKPWPPDSDDPGNTSPDPADPDDGVGGWPAYPNVDDAEIPWHCPANDPEPPDLWDADTEPTEEESEPTDGDDVGTAFLPSDTTPIVPNRAAKPRIAQANIIGFSVDEIKNGGNKGDPFWRIETDAALNVCIFSLDVLVRDRYISRADALNGWREIGKKFVANLLPGSFRLNAKGYYDLTAVQPPAEHQEQVRASDQPKPFVPQNLMVISDVVNEAGKSTTARTADLEEVRLNMKASNHIAAVGYDISTWTHAEPYVRQPIPVTVDADGFIEHVQAPTGAWTESRHVYKLKRGDLLYLADEETPCHPIAGVRKTVNSTMRYLTFADGHPPITVQGIQYVALTQPDDTKGNHFPLSDPERGEGVGTAFLPSATSDLCLKEAKRSGVPADYVAPPLPDHLLTEAGA